MRRAFLVFVLVLAALPADAQVEQCQFFREQIDDLAAGHLGFEWPILDPGQGAGCFAVALSGGDRALQQAFSNFTKKFEGSRSDKQSGGDSSASGATSVVAQGP